MKTEKSALLHYSASPLKVIETDHKDIAWLSVIRKEDTVKNHRFSFSNNDSINDPSAWDASWFTNYE